MITAINLFYAASWKVCGVLMVLFQKEIEWNNWSAENATSIWGHIVISIWETDLTRTILCENLTEKACDKTFKIMNKTTREYSFTCDLIIYWAVCYKGEGEIMRGWCNKGCKINKIKNLSFSFSPHCSLFLLSPPLPLSPIYCGGCVWACIPVLIS